MAKRIVCTDCAAPIFRRIKSGMSEVVPQPVTATKGASCAGCGQSLEGGN